MNSKVLIILLDNGTKEEREHCLKSIEEQSYKDMETLIVDYKISVKTLCNLLTEKEAEFVLFMHSCDAIGVDYCRTLAMRAAIGFDVVAGEFVEKIEDDIYYPNRTFNQNQLTLYGNDIMEMYTKLRDLDYSWNVIWGKLYKIQHIKMVLKEDKIIGGNLINLEKEINSRIFAVIKSFSSVQHNYYYRKIAENKWAENTKKNKDYFARRYVKCGDAFFYEEIKKAIVCPEIKVVSFDIFDTLILRPFLYPTDLFIVLEQFVDSLIVSVDGIAFKKLRVLAEMQVREDLKSQSEVQDVTLDQIYEELSVSCPLLNPYIDKIKNKEIELELQYCYARKSGKELYELVRSINKKIIYTSDMYLPSEVIKRLLIKNGYDTGEVFVSCVCGKTKATGDLYSYVMEKIDCGANNILHIGDNFTTDVVNARGKAWTAFHFPKTEELFNNWNANIYTGHYFSDMFESRCGIVQNYDAKELFGIRCMMALCANELYDYPFNIYDTCSDFNGNPYNIGYFTLGMHLYAVVRWLIDENEKNKYENMHFMARDGYLVKKAFQILERVFKTETNIYYTYMSRKALVPLTIQSKADCYNLMSCFNGVNILPKVVFDVLQPVIQDVTDAKKVEFCKEIDIDYFKPIGTEKKFLALSDMIAEKLFDEKKAKDFKTKFAKCFDAQFKGKTATFDMGYSARGESILKENFDYDITANYIHTCLDKAYQRMIKSGVKVNCFYDFTPYISGIAREMLMSELSGSCIGYDFQENAAIPQLEEYDAKPATYYAIHFMHEGALAFVEKMVNVFGEYNKSLMIRNHYASIPFDYYLDYSKAFDRSIFSDTVFEDDMGLGSEINFEQFWERMIHRMAGGTTNRINYNAYGRIRRYFLMIAYGDLGEIKIRVKEKLYCHKVLYTIVKKMYNESKAIYHKIRNH